MNHLVLFLVFLEIPFFLLYDTLVVHIYLVRFYYAESCPMFIFLGSALRVLPFVMLYIYLSRMRKFNKQDLNLSHRIQVGRYLIHRNPVFIRIDKTRCLPCIISIDVTVRFRFFVFLAPSILLNYLEFQSLDNEHQIKYLHVHFSLSSPFHKI